MSDCVFKLNYYKDSIEKCLINSAIVAKVAAISKSPRDRSRRVWFRNICSIKV